MASFTQRFNNIGEVAVTKPLGDLEVGMAYVIISMNRVSTRYGECLVAIVKEGEQKVKVFLPKRFGEEFTEEELRRTDFTNLRLVYKGMVAGAHHVTIIEVSR